MVKITAKEKIYNLIEQIPEDKLALIIPYFEIVVIPDIVSDEYSTDPHRDHECKYDSNGKRIYTIQDIEYLPNFMRIELIDGEMTGHQDYVTIEVDDEVFTTKPTITHPVTYRVSIQNEDK